MSACEVAVVGAGVVGLAIARRLAQMGREVVVLERNVGFGCETSSRSSEVIHAGLYYPAGTLKAELCVRGRALLYEFCAEYRVSAKAIGKLLVATEDDHLQKLADIQRLADANGVKDLTILSRKRAQTMEPALRFTEVLYSPSTGIIDSHAYMTALLGSAEDHGAQWVRDAEVIRITRRANGYILHIRNGNEEVVLEPSIVINAAGMWAQSVAARIEGLDTRYVPPLILAKGSYASCSGPIPFRHLIYPIPEPGGVGVHLTLDMAGHGRFGPDVEWLDIDNPEQIDYMVRPQIAAHLLPRIRQYWPFLTMDRLTPDYAGVRSKISGPLEAAGDFRIDGPDFHGLPGLVNLFGIESPGLTASLAIAERIGAILKDF